jgi:hypothetical protein
MNKVLRSRGLVLAPWPQLRAITGLEGWPSLAGRYRCYIVGYQAFRVLQRVLQGCYL